MSVEDVVWVFLEEIGFLKFENRKGLMVMFTREKIFEEVEQTLEVKQGGKDAMKVICGPRPS